MTKRTRIQSGHVRPFSDPILFSRDDRILRKDKVPTCCYPILPTAAAELPRRPAVAERVRRASEGRKIGVLDLYAFSVYKTLVLFIETPTFTRLITTLLSDDEYADLQADLSANPERGDLIRGSGGVRKVRFAVRGRGKSGGIRVIYYWVRREGHILMLIAYPKSRKDNLTAAETTILRKLVKEL